MIISAHKNNYLDPPVYNLLKEINSPVPIVQISSLQDYVFNPSLYELKEWILADFCEYGANDFNDGITHVWGVNIELFPKAQTEEWKKFDQFVKDNPPALIFKRELLKDCNTENVYPINFPCLWEIPAIQTKFEFESRPLEVFNVWGYSHELRRMLHGEIFINAVKRNRAVIDNFSHLSEEIKDKRKKWLTVFTPWHSRYDMKDVLSWQGLSKLSVSLPGAGFVCFRHSEACINSAMVMRDDPVRWSYDWINGENCIKFPVGKDADSIRGITGAKQAIETIEEALNNPLLYEIYCEGVNTCHKYSLHNYVSNYIEPIIKKHLC